MSCGSLATVSRVQQSHPRDRSRVGSSLFQQFLCVLPPHEGTLELTTDNDSRSRRCPVSDHSFTTTLAWSGSTGVGYDDYSREH